MKSSEQYLLLLCMKSYFSNDCCFLCCSTRRIKWKFWMKMDKKKVLFYKTGLFYPFLFIFHWRIDNQQCLTYLFLKKLHNPCSILFEEEAFTDLGKNKKIFWSYALLSSQRYEVGQSLISYWDECKMNYSGLSINS